MFSNRSSLFQQFDKLSSNRKSSDSKSEDEISLLSKCELTSFTSVSVIAFSSSIVYSALVVVMMMAATGTGTGSGSLSVVQATTLVGDILTTVSSTTSSSSDFVHWMAEHFHFQEEQDEKKEPHQT